MSAWKGIAGSAILAALAVSPAAASTMPLTGGELVNLRVRSMVALRFKGVVRQSRDLSCGAAALATLLTYYYGDKIGEQEIIKGIFEFGDEEKIKKDGFSMLELKKYGERRQYVSQGFRIPNVADLEKLKVPVLTLLNTRGYNHFVVIKGVKDGQVFIADPAFGNTSRPIEEFAKAWSNVILVFLSRQKNGTSQFTLDPMLKAPMDTLRYLLDPGLGRIRPGFGEF